MEGILTQHRELIVAADFFTVEVWTNKGLQRFLVLFFIELSTRRVKIGGISSANSLWMSQIARNLTESVDGLLAGKRYLIHDRDPLFTAEFLGNASRRRCGISGAAAPKAQSERARRKICAQYQRTLSGTADPVRRKFVADSG